MSEVADRAGAAEADPNHDPFTGDVVGMALGDQPRASEEPSRERQNLDRRFRRQPLPPPRALDPPPDLDEVSAYARRVRHSTSAVPDERAIVAILKRPESRTDRVLN